MKKTLNVHFSANLIDESIVRFLKQDFEINIINLSKNEINNSKQETVNVLKTIDLIIFTGGEDVHPSFYGENVGKYTHTNEKRDRLEWELLTPRKLPSSIIKAIPKLGICRGAQLLTVYNGGKLIQHVEGHKNNEQVIEIMFGKSIGSYDIKVSSDHHQMMYPYNLPESYYELIGYSKNFQSNTYLNGDNNEIDLPKNFLEPEIVYYKNKNSLCIQSHPEWCIGSDGSNFCLKLINKYLLKNDFKLEVEEEFPLPNSMSSFPMGWNVWNSLGEHLVFDGENFIPSQEYKIKYTQSFSTSNYTKHDFGNYKSENQVIPEKISTISDKEFEYELTSTISDESVGQSYDEFIKQHKEILDKYSKKTQSSSNEF